MSAATATRIVPARPRIAVAGQDNPSLAEGLLALRVQESTDGMFRCEATFGDWGTRSGGIGSLYADRALLDFGKELTLSLAGSRIFRGRISGLEGSYPEGGAPQLTVLAEDRWAELRTRRRTRTFTDQTDAAVIETIAREHGLLTDVRLTGPTHRVLAQLNQSDLAFIRERARLHAAELWIDDRTVKVRARSERASASEELTLGYGNELREFRVLADLAGQRSDLTVCGWDVAAKQAITQTAGRNTVAGELHGGQSGAAVLESALGARHERVVHSTPLTMDEARTRAEALYRGMARRFVVGRGIARTVPGLRVGVVVRLLHLGPLFSGTYYVTGVTHQFDGEDGLRTEFTAERAALGGER